MQADAIREGDEPKPGARGQRLHQRQQGRLDHIHEVFAPGRVHQRQHQGRACGSAAERPGAC